MGTKTMSVLQAQVVVMMMKKIPRCFTVYITLSHKDTIILHFVSSRTKAQREQLASPRSLR